MNEVTDSLCRLSSLTVCKFDRRSGPVFDGGDKEFAEKSAAKVRNRDNSRGISNSISKIVEFCLKNENSAQNQGINSEFCGFLRKPMSTNKLLLFSAGFKKITGNKQGIPSHLTAAWARFSAANAGNSDGCWTLPQWREIHSPPGLRRNQERTGGWNLKKDSLACRFPGATDDVQIGERLFQKRLQGCCLLRTHKDPVSQRTA